MILPERVFGMSGTIQTLRGRAIGLISVATAWEMRSSSSRLAAMPGFRQT